MATVATIARFLETFAPTVLAESWDNVGLLVGDRGRPVSRVMTCLTITSEVAAEAVEEQAELIVVHHPLPFRPLSRVTTDTVEGALLVQLLGAGIAVYSPHTAFDSAAGGINQQLAEGLGLKDIAPLSASEAMPAVGTGRTGRLGPQGTLSELLTRAKSFLSLEHLQVVGDPSMRVDSAAIGCGSAGELLSAASDAGCQAFVTGEARFHTCLEAQALGLGLVLVGHYASERFGVETLARVLANEFSDLAVWASRREADPIAFA